jgi:hypothetical protein
MRLFGPGLSLEALEIRRGQVDGYEFLVIGDAREDPRELMTTLLGKIRRTLAVKHITYVSGGVAIADHRVVRGRITWDEDQDGEVPLLIVDGRPVSWAEFGRMLMVYEGWQFKLEIRDPSEEI